MHKTKTTPFFLAILIIFFLDIPISHAQNLEDLQGKWHIISIDGEDFSESEEFIEVHENAWIVWANDKIVDRQNLNISGDLIGLDESTLKVLSFSKQKIFFRDIDEEPESVVVLHKVK